MLSLNYDLKYDILSIGIGDKKNSYGDEEYGGLLVIRNEETSSITGFMIFGFGEKYKNNALPPFPDGISISIEDEILPFIEL